MSSDDEKESNISDSPGRFNRITQFIWDNKSDDDDNTYENDNNMNRRHNIPDLRIEDLKTDNLIENPQQSPLHPRISLGEFKNKQLILIRKLR